MRYRWVWRKFWSAPLVNSHTTATAKPPRRPEGGAKERAACVGTMRQRSAKPPRRVVLARGYLQVGIGDPKLSILFAWKMQYALTLTVVPFEFHLPPIVILGWDGH